MCFQSKLRGNLIVTILLLFNCVIKAGQFRGGELGYKLLNRYENSYTYEISFTIYRDCKSDAELNDPVIKILNTTDITKNKHPLTYLEVTLDERVIIPMPYSPVFFCVINDPLACTELIVFKKQVTLPASAEGYTLFYSGCCRSGITNIQQPSWNSGTEIIYGVPEPGQSLTYFCKIPPHILITENSSPQSMADSVIYACEKRPFVYTLQYNDPDRDSLAYKLCSSIGKTSVATTSFQTIPFLFGYSIESPISGNASFTLDERTGHISGIPPKAGQYALVVCIEEYRSGQLINSHRKELQLDVNNCEIKKQADIINCSDSTAVFTHANNPSNNYFWDFGVPGISHDTSVAVLPIYKYPSAGIYSVKMKVTNPRGCYDSIMSSVKIFPGLRPDFSWSDIRCSEEPITFLNRTTSPFGNITELTWKTINPRRTIGNTNLVQYRHKVTGNIPYPLSVQLTAKTDLGCLDSVLKVIEIYPAVSVDAGEDRIIAFNQPYTIPANSSGATSFKWAPSVGLNNPFAKNPVVNGPIDMSYIVLARNEGGCMATDTINLKYMKGPDIYVPSAFSPDNDGLNDRLHIFPVSMYVQSFRIYDRGGTVLFETNNYKQGWDGRFKNQLLSTGIYVWVIQAKDTKGNPVIKKGTILLIR